MARSLSDKLIALGKKKAEEEAVEREIASLEEKFRKLGIPYADLCERNRRPVPSWALQTQRPSTAETQARGGTTGDTTRPNIDPATGQLADGCHIDLALPEGGDGQDGSSAAPGDGMVQTEETASADAPELRDGTRASEGDDSTKRLNPQASAFTFRAGGKASQEQFVPDEPLMTRKDLTTAEKLAEKRFWSGSEVRPERPMGRHPSEMGCLALWLDGHCAKDSCAMRHDWVDGIRNHHRFKTLKEQDKLPELTWQAMNNFDREKANKEKLERDRRPEDPRPVKIGRNTQRHG